MCDCFSCRLEAALEGKEFEEIQKEVEMEDYLDLDSENYEDSQDPLYDPIAD